MNWFVWKDRSGMSQQSGNADSGKIYVANKERLRELEKAAKRDGESEWPGQYDDILSQYELQIALEARQWIRNSSEEMYQKDSLIYPRFIQIRKDYQEAFEQYESKKKELGGRPVSIQMKAILYWPLVMLMSACEVFINFQAFETLFPEASITAMMASVVLAVILLFAAHSIGGAVQQRTNKGWASLLGMLLLGITFGLAYIRFQYIDFSNNNEAALFAHPRLNADMITIFFFLFNLLFLALASWMAAKLHDKDESYDQRYKAYLKTREKLVKISNYSAQIIFIKSNKVLDRVFVKFFQNPTSFRLSTEHCFIRPK